MCDLQKKYNLDFFKSQDDLGDSYLELVGLDSIGTEVYWTYGCDKENCNCIGSWSNGNINEVEYFIDRPS
jgi:hypothetical protein